MTEKEADRSGGGPPGKVGRVIREYELDGTGAELERRWTGEGGESMSLRALSDWFNQRVLGAAMERAGLRPLDGEVENTYRLLEDEGVSAGMREQTRRQLERDGVDLGRTEKDFVSHQAIYTYLTNHRGAVHPSSGEESTEERIERELGKLEALVSRTTAVTEDTLTRLANADAIAAGDLDVLVDVQVSCRECGAVSSVTGFVERGGCDCGSE
ncbi:rod-determining factor RdfA [Natronorarus salvus]|uniref:rod-determining factor RdfA n=1 Tax=Natronorarus salvus TaxID=3117733 RepID=UPI002F2638FF